jgi:hypothetical protein
VSLVAERYFGELMGLSIGLEDRVVAQAAVVHGRPRRKREFPGQLGKAAVLDLEDCTATVIDALRMADFVAEHALRLGVETPPQFRADCVTRVRIIDVAAREWLVVSPQTHRR